MQELMGQKNISTEKWLMSIEEINDLKHTVDKYK